MYCMVYLIYLQIKQDIYTRYLHTWSYLCALTRGEAQQGAVEECAGGVGAAHQQPVARVPAQPAHLHQRHESWHHYSWHHDIMTSWHHDITTHDIMTSLLMTHDTCHLEAAVVWHPVPDSLLRLRALVLVPAEADLAAAHPGHRSCYHNSEKCNYNPSKVVSYWLHFAPHSWCERCVTGDWSIISWGDRWQNWSCIHQSAPEFCNWDYFRFHTYESIKTMS